MFVVNQIAIAIEPELGLAWTTLYPDLSDLFEGEELILRIAPSSYRPVWETASTVTQGYKSRFTDRSLHRLEGFDVTLAADCNRASVYYLLRDVEERSKNVPCGEFAGVMVKDYLLPDVKDIKAGLEYSDRPCLLEVENTAGAMGTGGKRSLFGTRLIFQILD